MFHGLLCAKSITFKIHLIVHIVTSEKIDYNIGVPNLSYKTLENVHTKSGIDSISVNYFWIKFTGQVFLEKINPTHIVVGQSFGPGLNTMGAY